MKNRHLGSSLDDFLKDENIYEEAQTQAIKEVRPLYRLKRSEISDKSLCQNCGEGHLHYDTREVEIVRMNLRAAVPNISGTFCDNCDEINFDDETNSAVRYAAAGDELVLKARNFSP
jgi:hypothetical protein